MKSEKVILSPLVVCLDLKYFKLEVALDIDSFQTLFGRIFHHLEHEVELCFTLNERVFFRRRCFLKSFLVDRISIGNHHIELLECVGEHDSYHYKGYDRPQVRPVSACSLHIEFHFAAKDVKHLHFFSEFHFKLIITFYNRISSTGFWGFGVLGF